MDGLRHEVLFGSRVVRCFADRPTDIWAMVAAGADLNAPALRWGLGEEVGEMRYGELLARAEALAGGLAARGVAAGDRMASWLSNRAEYPIWFLACWRLGAVLVPMDTRLSGSEAAHILADSGARVLLAEAALADRLGEQRPELTVLVDVDEGDSLTVPALERLGKGAPLSAKPPAPEALAAILYTSGTTGQPKGVMLSHVNIVHSVLHFARSWGLPRGSITGLAIPGSNITGLVTEFLTFFHLRGSVVLMPPFRAESFLAHAAFHRIDHAFMVPAQYKLCLMHPDIGSHDLSAWRLGSFGGAPMPAAFIAELREKLPGLDLSNGYGATETASPVTLLPAHLTPLYPDAIGLAVPCADLCIMDDQGREVADGEQGELWVSGPMVAMGYWQNEAATREAFVGGWWRSGDIVSRDANGLVRLHDRKKDVVNRGGYKIYSAEVEALIAIHPAVAEVAIVGKPDPVLGERVHAFVCLHPEADPAVDLAGHTRELMADYKCPESWTIGHEPLPRNSNGKLLKRALRDQLAGGA